MISREKIPPGSDSPRRPTRSDLRNFIASAVGRLRNSPGRIFQRLDSQADSRKHCNVEPLKWATRVIFRHWLPISSPRACESRRACGTRSAEFFNGWARKRIRAKETAKKSQKWSAVKSPLGAQTVLGDRHDPDYEVLLQEPSVACGTRPRELSNGWARKRIRASTAASSL